MFLNLFIKLKDFFASLFQKLKIDNFNVLLLGIVLGFMLCIVLYFLLIVISMRTKKNFPNDNAQEVDEKIQKLITSAKNEYTEEFSSKSLKEKTAAVKELSWNLIQQIARIYYPDSEFPIYELSIDELLVLNHYITDRIDSLFKGKFLKQIRKVRISFILHLIEINKKIERKKLIKAANTKPVSGGLKVASGILNAFNPFYWVQKFMIGTTMTIATNKMALTILNIVGEETNIVYSRSVFNIEKEASKQFEKDVYELETMAEKEGD